MSVAPGQVIDGKYRILRLIGEGGMGAVYQGENVLIHRKVALKILNSSSACVEENLRRFEREAQAAGEIGNDHILEVYDVGALHDGARYMVMEYLDGESLGARIQRHLRMTPEQVAPLARQLLAGLQAAHSAGIIHRDLKPDNIFIVAKAGRTDFVKLIDFGISKFSMGEPLNLTRAGELIGTPFYMSPEQARGTGDADVRSDVYAVGVILYEAVTGRVPFEADNFNELLFKIALSDPPPPSVHVPGLDKGFERLISRAMAREPAERFQSVEEFSRALAAWEESLPTSPVPAPPEAGMTSSVDTSARARSGFWARLPWAPIGIAALLACAATAVVLLVASSSSSTEPVIVKVAPGRSGLTSTGAPSPPAEPAEPSSPAPAVIPAPEPSTAAAPTHAPPAAAPAAPPHAAAPPVAAPPVAAPPARPVARPTAAAPVAPHTPVAPRPAVSPTKPAPTKPKGSRTTPDFGY